VGWFASLTPEVSGWLTGADAHLVHGGVFLLLFLGGIGLPIPEDIPLLLAGVALAKEIVSAHWIFVTCYTGVVLGDQIMYLIGYKFGNKLLGAGQRSPLFPAVTPERIEEIRDGLRRRRLAYIFLGRHLFPIRSVTFIAAGALGIPFREFLVADMFAALVSVTLVLALGYFLGQRLTPEHIEYLAHQANTIILVSVIVGVVGYLIHRRIKKNRRVKTD